MIDRRALLKIGLAALAGTAVPARRVFSAGIDTTPSVIPSSDFPHGASIDRPVRLPRVLVSPDRVIRTVTGLRPFRPSGFVIRANRIGEKVIIHNYGHGGCGVTLSWGTAQLAVDLALKTPFRQAAVLGCGAVGLATARLLQDHGFHVTIYAKDLPPNTTSNIAGALWEPVTLTDHDRRTPEFATQFAQASRFAYRYFQTLAGDKYGVKWVEMFYVSDSPMGTSWQATVTPELYLTTSLDEAVNPFKAPFVGLRHSMIIEPNVYLPAVISDFWIRGGRVEVKEFQSLASIMRLRERLIVNCTGLGSKALFKDDELVPIKGQLTVLVPQSEINYGTISVGNDLYMFPRRDGIVLGGSHERGEWSLEPNPTESDRILKGQQEFFNTLR